jgi:hypothetical protein
MLRLALPRAAAVLALPALALLSACATPEAQLRTGLMNAGLSKPMAGCMARPMADQLSVNQLLKLRSLSKVGELDPRRTSYDQFMRRIRALQDAEILRVTASAGALRPPGGGVGRRHRPGAAGHFATLPTICEPFGPIGAPDLPLRKRPLP